MKGVINMKFDKILKCVKTLDDYAERNKPALLSGAAIGGVLLTAYSAYKAGIKAKDILENYKNDKKLIEEGDKETEMVVKKECVVEMTKTVLPTVIFGGATIACIVGSTVESSRRIAVLSAAYALSEKKSENLQKKMEEVLGKEKADEIRKETRKEEAENTPKPVDDPMVQGSGNVWCYDAGQGRWFRVKNTNELERKILLLSQMCMSEMFISMNQLYKELGLDLSSYGDDFGWNVDDLVGGRLPIDINDTIMNDVVGEPAIIMDYNIKSRDDYRKLY